MKSLLQEVIDAADELEVSSDRMERAIDRLRGCSALDGEIFLNAAEIIRTAGGRDWHFVLDPNGRMRVLFRQKGIVELRPAEEFRLEK